MFRWVAQNQGLERHVFVHAGIGEISREVVKYRNGCYSAYTRYSLGCGTSLIFKDSYLLTFWLLLRKPSCFTWPSSNNQRLMEMAVRHENTKEGKNWFWCHFRQLWLYWGEIETRNQEWFPAPRDANSSKGYFICRNTIYMPPQRRTLI